MLFYHGSQHNAHIYMLKQNCVL